MARTPLQPFARDGGLIVFAHRGGSRRYPENTLFAFEQAAAMGVDALEMDIHQTADNHLVVIHDPTVDRTTNGQGAIKEMTLAQLKQLDAGYWWTNDNGTTFPYRGRGITIPTLAEIFETFPDFWINIDLKDANEAQVEQFIGLIRQYNMQDKVVAGSFTDTPVHWFRQKSGGMATAVTYSEARQLVVLSKIPPLPNRLYWGSGEMVQVSAYNGRLPIATPAFIKTCHQNNLPVHIWTVDDLQSMRHLIQIGVDGIMTDYPDVLMRLLGRL